jgi:hypothetical protein
MDGFMTLFRVGERAPVPNMAERVLEFKFLIWDASPSESCDLIYRWIFTASLFSPASTVQDWGTSNWTGTFSPSEVVLSVMTKRA